MAKDDPPALPKVPPKSSNEPLKEVSLATKKMSGNPQPLPKPSPQNNAAVSQQVVDAAVDSAMKDQAASPTETSQM